MVPHPRRPRTPPPPVRADDDSRYVRRSVPHGRLSGGPPRGGGTHRARPPAPRAARPPAQRPESETGRGSRAAARPPRPKRRITAQQGRGALGGPSASAATPPSVRYRYRRPYLRDLESCLRATKTIKLDGESDSSPLALPRPAIVAFIIGSCFVRIQRSDGRRVRTLRRGEASHGAPWSTVTSAPTVGSRSPHH